MQEITKKTWIKIKKNPKLNRKHCQEQSKLCLIMSHQGIYEKLKMEINKESGLISKKIFKEAGVVNVKREKNDRISREKI